MTQAHKSPREEASGLTAQGLSNILRLQQQDGIDSSINPVNVNPVINKSPECCRRSFYAVGQSCVINLNPTQSHAYGPSEPVDNNHDTPMPTFRGGDKQRMRRDVLANPAIGRVWPPGGSPQNGLLITGIGMDKVDRSQSITASK